LKAVVAGGGDVGKLLAESLQEIKVEVTLIESDAERAQSLAEELDCAVLHGDAATLSVLKDADCANADLFVAATGDDRSNILSALLAKQLGAKRVVVILEDPSLEDVARGLGLENVVIPARLAVKEVIAIARGTPRPSEVLGEGVTLVKIPVKGSLPGTSVSNLKLPEGTVLCAVIRGGKILQPSRDLRLEEGDELLFLVKEEKLPNLRKALGGED